MVDQAKEMGGILFSTEHGRKVRNDKDGQAGKAAPNRFYIQRL